MKSFVVSLAFLAGSASALIGTDYISEPNVTYITEVVTEYTTYCPEPTHLTFDGKVYTVTEATNFTITDCPCTVHKPVHISVATVCHDCPNETTDVPASYPTGTAAPPPPPPYSPPGPAGTARPPPPPHGLPGPAGTPNPPPPGPAGTGFETGYVYPIETPTVIEAGASKVVAAGLAGIIAFAVAI